MFTNVNRAAQSDEPQ